MTQLEFDRILSSINALSPEQIRRLQRVLNARLAMTATPAGPSLGLLGAMCDAADELDAIVERTATKRRERPR